MQRNTSMWIYFLSLLLAAGMTLALLPACGGGGGGGSCNTERGESEAEEGFCEDEEVGEEEVEALDEAGHESTEESGDPNSGHFLEEVDEFEVGGGEEAHEIEDLDELT